MGLAESAIQDAIRMCSMSETSLRYRCDITLTGIAADVEKAKIGTTLKQAKLSTEKLKALSKRF